MTCVLGEGQNISCSMADGILEFYIRYIERGYDPLAPHIDRGFSPHIDRGYERVSDGGIDRGFNPRIYRGLERGHERGVRLTIRNLIYLLLLQILFKVLENIYKSYCIIIYLVQISWTEPY